MKKLFLCLPVVLMFLLPYNLVNADEGGTPNEKTGLGPVISDAAKTEGGMGQFVNSKTGIRVDLNNDGKVNGQDVAAFVDLIKDLF